MIKKLTKPAKTAEPKKIKITPPIRISEEDYKIYKANLVRQSKKLCDEIGNLISAEVARMKATGGAR